MLSLLDGDAGKTRFWLDMTNGRVLCGSEFVAIGPILDRLSLFSWRSGRLVGGSIMRGTTQPLDGELESEL